VADCFYLNNQGRLELSTASDPCTYRVMTDGDYQTYSALMGVAMPTPEEILYVYTWGMGAILLPFSIALAVKWAVRMVKMM